MWGTSTSVRIRTMTSPRNSGLSTAIAVAPVLTCKRGASMAVTASVKQLYLKCMNMLGGAANAPPSPSINNTMNGRSLIAWLSPLLSM